MGKTLIIRVETESRSIYQMRESIGTQVTMLTRVPGPDAAALISEPCRVLSYQPIVKGRPFVVTVVDDWDGENRILMSTNVKTVDVWLV